MLAVGLVAACIVGEAAVLRLGIDDLDEGYFVQQAMRVTHGQVPYRDFESLYTPGLVYLHAATFASLGGPSLLATRALALIARTGLVVLLYVVARPLVRQPLWAAFPGVLLLVAMDDAPVRWEPHPGWLSTFFAVLAAWCASHRPSAAWLVTSGLAAGLAYLFKQNTGAVILAALILHAAFAGVRGGPNPDQGFARHFARERANRAGVPLAAFVGLTALWLVPLVAAVDGNLASLRGLGGAVNMAGLFSPPEATILIPLAALAGGVWLVRREPDPRLRWLLLASAALFVTQYPRMDTLHLAWSAPLLLVVGAVALDRARPVVAGIVLVSLGLLTLPMASSRLEAVLEPAAPIADVLAPIRTRDDLQRTVEDIQRRTRQDEPIFVYPTSPLLYVLADRDNPTRFDHLNPGAADATQIDQVIADLAAANVRLVVISDFWQVNWGPPGANFELEAWLANRFTEVGRHGAYRVLMAGL